MERDLAVEEENSAGGREKWGRKLGNKEGSTVDNVVRC